MERLTRLAPHLEEKAHRIPNGDLVNRKGERDFGSTADLEIFQGSQKLIIVLYARSRGGNLKIKGPRVANRIKMT